VSLVFRNGYATHSSLGLVDSGADFTIFPAGFAKILKLELGTSRPRSFAGTTGRIQFAYPARCELTILSPDDSEQAFVISDFEAYFCLDFEIAGGGLLGQDGFFSRFHASFDQPNGRFSLELIKKPSN
jgi:hypothetical protein